MLKFPLYLMVFMTNLQPAMPPGLPPRLRHPGLLRLRQERGARRQLPLRPAGRG
jgi:hypothetical protein